MKRTETNFQNTKEELIKSQYEAKSVSDKLATTEELLQQTRKNAEDLQKQIQELQKQLDSMNTQY